MILSSLFSLLPPLNLDKGGGFPAQGLRGLEEEFIGGGGEGEIGKDQSPGGESGNHVDQLLLKSRLVA